MKQFKLPLLFLLFGLLLQLDSYAQFVKGADISWVTQMEASGVKFYNNDGQQQDLYLIMKDKGINTIRLRVWVDPWEGWSGKADVLNKAIRAKDAGLRVMIDFHYSDSWADPGKQYKPAAWENYSFSELTQAVYDHTADVLNTLKSNGIDVDWVQVGNETNDGMLWEDGRASENMWNYAQLINSGYDAVKSVYQSAKVIVHVSNGYDNSLFRWHFDGLKNNGAKWDVIGMSLYPDKRNWQTLNNQCQSNMKDMVARYGKEVMVVEVGMEDRLASDCKSFLIDLMEKTASISNGKGLGVMYWEPQTHDRWQGYTKGAFNKQGQPTIAMDAWNSFNIATVSNTSTSTKESLGKINSSIEDESLEISSYPNPVESSLTVIVPADLNHNSELHIYNSSGQVVLTSKVNDRKLSLDVSSFAEGLYFVKVSDGLNGYVIKFLKK